MPKGSTCVGLYGIQCDSCGQLLQITGESLEDALEGAVDFDWSIGEKDLCAYCVVEPLAPLGISPASGLGPRWP
jgi:hypothetical protein